MKEKVYYIYEITCDINNKKYIGQHYGYLDDKYIGSGKAIKAAIEKYGKEHFHKNILMICQDREDANIQERVFTDAVQAETNPEYYNLIPGGDCSPSFLGHHHTEETKQKMSEAQLGEKNHRYGTTHTEEEKYHLSVDSPKARPVICVETGVIYPGAKCAERALGISLGTIHKVCNHYKYRKTAGGYHWEWYEGEKEE